MENLYFVKADVIKDAQKFASEDALRAHIEEMPEPAENYVLIRGAIEAVHVDRKTVVSVTFGARVPRKEDASAEGAIVAELRGKDGVTLAALAAALNAPRPVVHEAVMRLRRRKLVTCTGKGKGAKWRVVEQAAGEV